MFSFQITIKGEERRGSVVSTPFPLGPGAGSGMYVVIMWDDDFTFSTVNVDQLQAISVEEKEAEIKGENVVAFPMGAPDDTTH